MCYIYWLSDLRAVGVMGCRSNRSRELWAVGIETRRGKEYLHETEGPGQMCTLK